MDDFTRRELGSFLGFVAGAAIGGGMSYLLGPWARRGRLWRTALWGGAWALAGWSCVAVDIGIAGSHQVYSRRGLGGWYDMHVTRADALALAALGAVVGATCGWRTVDEGAPAARSGVRRRRRRRKRRARHLGG